ncbi:unnamed protein product [Didymodactylos carnosus]|uniref:G-protein coupled receptors family 1 profile domain-containing protein n=1 Tax=Didymodactylos carnosus TaxID=1234261 RepID=A0A815WLJ3_9BILA|nr:unnamed protein product [Didymodactylos carnosus]CAF1545015.1 unnamed protein product [Didymodactylos carnosus]CAF4085976.1 unnamed protein product [Didymodactylos carnosus]CAF4405664.1 unnamed protein product [Didymodactylos carnosus]
MSAFTTLLNEISRQLTIYVGLFVFILGTVGSLLNIYIFLSKKSFRSNSCAVYLLCASIYDLLYLFNAVLPRILTAFNIDPTTTSSVYCKLKFYLTLQFSLAAITFVLLAAVNRWLCSCRNARYREWSNIKNTRLSIFITVISCMLTPAPVLIYYDNINGKCSSISTAFSFYVSYFLNFIQFAVLSIILPVYFGVRTYKNLHQRTAPVVRVITVQRGISIRQRIENQLTRMLLLQICAATLFTAPYAVQLIYSNITAYVEKDLLRLAQENLFTTITRLAVYLSNASRFYIYFISSREIRKIFIH